MKSLLVASVALVAVASAAQAQDDPFSWNGFYLGAELGSSSSSTDFDASDTDFADDYREDALIGGVFAGRDWQSGQVVYGVVGDFDLLHSADLAFGDSDALTGGKGEAYTYDVDWVATARARLGYTPTDRVLVYGTGGIAAGRFDATSYLGTENEQVLFLVDQASASYSGVKWGGVIGAGVDFALPNDWSLKVEYLHYEFDKIEFGGDGVPDTSFRPRLDAVKFGLAYRF